MISIITDKLWHERNYLGVACGFLFEFVVMWCMIVYDASLLVDSVLVSFLVAIVIYYGWFYTSDRFPAVRNTNRFCSVRFHNKRNYTTRYNTK